MGKNAGTMGQATLVWLDAVDGVVKMLENTLYILGLACGVLDPIFFAEYAFNIPTIPRISNNRSSIPEHITPMRRIIYM